MNPKEHEPGKAPEFSSVILIGEPPMATFQALSQLKKKLRQKQSIFKMMSSKP